MAFGSVFHRGERKVGVPLQVYSFVGGVFLPFDSKNGPQAELMETFKKTNLSAAKDPGRAGKDSSTLDSHTDLCTIQKLEDMLAPCF